MLVARRRDHLDALSQELQARHGIQVTPIEKDLVPQEAACELIDELQDRDPKIDVVVNNAGFGALGKVHRLDADRQADMIQLNVLALFKLTRGLLPGMLESSDSRPKVNRGVLNVASLAGFLPGPNMSVYYATKAFVLHFTEGLAQELKGTGLSVSCLCPGPTATEFGEASGMDDAKFFKPASMSAERVAKAGFEGFENNQTIVIPGASNKLGRQLLRLSPRGAVRKLVAKLQRPGGD